MQENTPIQNRTEAEDILGVNAPYTAEDVETAYRRLAKVYHPDVVTSHGGNPKVAESYLLKIISAKDFLLEELGQESPLDPPGQPGFSNEELASAISKMKEMADKMRIAEEKRNDPVEKARREAKARKSRNDQLDWRCRYFTDELERLSRLQNTGGALMENSDVKKKLYNAGLALVRAWREAPETEETSYELAYDAFSEAELLLVSHDSTKIEENALQAVENISQSPVHGRARSYSNEDVVKAKEIIEKVFSAPVDNGGKEEKPHGKRGFLRSIFS